MKAAKKAPKDRSDQDSQLLRRHFLAYVFPKVPEEIKKFRGDAKKLEQESAKSAQELKKARDAVANAKPRALPKIEPRMRLSGLEPFDAA